MYSGTELLACNPGCVSLGKAMKRLQAISMRVGFDPIYFERNDTLAQLLNGTHESCGMDDSDCPSTLEARSIWLQGCWLVLLWG